MKSPLRNLLLILFCLFGSGAMVWATRLAFVPPPPEKTVVTPNRTVATEQEWIVGDVVGAIAGMARHTDAIEVKVTRGADVGGHSSFDVALAADHQQVTVVNHIWSPDTYAPLAQHLLGNAAAAHDEVDLAARDALTDLRVDVLLAQNRRISDALQANMRSASAHESAALLVGAFALREVSNFFGDVRPALSRMAAHLAMARALRGRHPIGRDGELAMVILTDLAGLQRSALEMLDAYHGVPAPGSPDRAWIRALRLRITGDWRAYHPTDEDALLEQLEYARAVRQRLGIDAFLDYMDTMNERDETLADWHRIAIRDSDISVEAGHRFATTSIDSELAEAEHVWTALHPGRIEHDALIAALNDRPVPSPVLTSGTQTRLDVLDWGSWAAFEQRNVLESLALNLLHVKNLGIEGRIATTLAEMDAAFGHLTLYPVVERWIAEDRGQYEDALLRARPVADAHPELLTAAEWNYLLKTPSFARHAVPFPVNVGWFEPAEPEGTAFDLPNRSLQPGCPRAPTLEHAAWFAREQPYDEWTVWANAWYQYPGVGRKPSADAIRKAFGPLAAYDDFALKHFVAYINLSDAERLELMQHRCDLDAGNCAEVAKWLLLDDRERDAARMNERFIAESRDEVAISHNVNWLVRYYRDHGRVDDAEALARHGAETQSRAGLEALADLLDAEGRYDQAEQVYRMIAEHYSNTAPLGTYLARRALAANDKALEVTAFELLRRDFPNGVERVPVYALPASPTDGVRFDTFGRRLARLGFEPADVIVSIDGWRVHNSAQEWDAWRLSTSEQVSFVVWRNGRYRAIEARVPQRWLGASFRDY